jgi:hypothetical protein
MNPPRLAVWILSAALASADRDAIIGDLEEELSSQSRLWFWRQVLMSLVPSLHSRWRRGNVQEAVLVPVLLVMLPFRALDLLWSCVLSNVPMRAAADRPIEFVCVSLACLAAGSFVSSRLVREPIATLEAVSLTALCLSTARGPLPLWYAAVSLILAAAGSYVGSSQRRLQ